jgi:tripartite-type tricarboxylate transporter receptor subunit TctC
MVIPFPPGGSNDVLGRALADGLSAKLGQPVVVENRTGAGGAIGAENVARSAPDGLSLLFVSSSIATGAAMQKLPYDPVADFTPVIEAAQAPMIVTVGRNFPARSLAELIAVARARPGQLRFGGAGIGDTSFFATQILNMAAGLEMEAVAYRGIMEAQLDTAAGRIEVCVTTLASARPLIEAGDLHVLAVSTPTRTASLPDVPSARELGVDYVTDVWWGLFAPARVPDPIAARLHNRAAEVMRGEAYARVSQINGAEFVPMSQAAFAEKVRNDVTRFRDIARRAGVAGN